MPCGGQQEYVQEEEQFIMSHNVNLMNNGAPRRIVYNAETAIDLSLCSPALEPELHWSIDASLLASDHCPIYIHYEEMQNIQRQNFGKNWNMREAQWRILESSEAWNDLPAHLNSNCEEIIADMYSRMERANRDALPVREWSKYYPKPWESQELKESKLRENDYVKNIDTIRYITI